MISELLKRVMDECNLRQVDLAEVLEISLSRVKAMTSGRVKNLTRAESEALVGKLGIRAAWLVTGEGPMLEDNETQDEFVNRQQAIARMRALISAMPMSDFTKLRLSALMTGDPAEDGPLIAGAVSKEAQGVDFVTGRRMDAEQELTRQEQEWLTIYRNSSNSVRAALKAAGNELTKSARKKDNAA